MQTLSSSENRIFHNELQNTQKIMTYQHSVVPKSYLSSNVYVYLFHSLTCSLLFFCYVLQIYQILLLYKNEIRVISLIISLGSIYSQSSIGGMSFIPKCTGRMKVDPCWSTGSVHRLAVV